MQPSHNKDNEQKKSPAAMPALPTGGDVAATKSNAIEIPQISLPKGGGAIKGIDEKFEVNAANGTASFSIPLPLSPGRNGFQPALSLSYNSGAGNSLFGIGWDLGLPSIQRKTDKKLPRYRDAEDSDTFMFSGVEDLVPLLLKDDDGNWSRDERVEGDFTIRRYRPRLEGAFSRIERIWKTGNPCFYWKVTTRDNVVTFFGKSKEYRIADPEDESRVFQWLPELGYDDKGSSMLFAYKSEDRANILDGPHEHNRRDGGPALFVNRHLKRVHYGDLAAFYPDTSTPEGIYHPENPDAMAYHFHLVLDYGEHGDLPAPGQSEVEVHFDEQSKWMGRHDAFSNYRAGFEVRNYRLCRRVLMFHAFRELGDAPCLVRSLDLVYRDQAAEKTTEGDKLEVTYLERIVQRGYVRLPGSAPTYSCKSLPPMSFEYQELRWNLEIRDVSPEDTANAPSGLTNGYQWVDLYGEGLSGILSEQGNGWYYKHNLGEGHFAPAVQVAPRPSLTGLADGVLQLQDLAADGRKQIVVNSPGLQGYYELADMGDSPAQTRWEGFRAFARVANVNLRDPNIRLLDLNGDGQPDIVLSEERVFTWYPAAGTQGYDAPELAPKPFDEERGPALVFSEPLQTIFLADMSGDGLTDLVRIRNGEVCYWPNLGYGRFGAKVTMANAPVFDTPDLFNPSYIQLADVSGTGATDILYLGKNRFTAWLNLSGNAWSAPCHINPFPETATPNQISVTDFLGNGTSCIVWSSPLPGHTQTPMRYIDLMGGIKPHIMTEYRNGTGKTTRVHYVSSTRFYLEDKKQGTPWITRLPFPVQCVNTLEIEDEVTGVKFSTRYAYHHGYYDHPEREFRGFGRVDQWDTEYFEGSDRTANGRRIPKILNQPPVMTRTWYHTGAFLQKERILNQFSHEYWYEEFRRQGFAVNPVEYQLPDAVVLPGDHLGGLDIRTLSAAEWQEALRACKGMVLRQEVFGLDAEKSIAEEKLTRGYQDDDPAFLAFQQKAREREKTPYTAATHTCEVQLLQRKEGNDYAVFIVKEREAITWHYERDPQDPRIAHTLNLETDELGNVLEAVSIVYPRLQTEPLLADDPADSLAARRAKEKGREGQRKCWITFTKNDFTNDILHPDAYLLRRNWQTRTYELTGFRPASGKLFAIADFAGGFSNWPALDYHRYGSGAAREKRLIEQVKTSFYNSALTAPLPFGEMAVPGITYEGYQLAYTPNLLADIFASSPHSAQFEVTEDDMRAGRFHEEDTNWWIRSGQPQFTRPGERIADIKGRFYLPVAYTDPYESRTEVAFDDYHIFIKRAADALGNETRVLEFNYRTLAPVRMMDPNDNLSAVVLDELGLVKAVATEGKDANGDGIGEEADNLRNITQITTGAERDEIREFFRLARSRDICNYTQLRAVAANLLGDASARMLYDFETLPVVVAGIAREQHAAQNRNPPLQISFEYTDGLGKVAMKKVQAEPGDAQLATYDASGRLTSVQTVPTGNQLRWVGNGRAVLNNKGNPILQYEPYFSVTPAWEDAAELVETGVTPVYYYDAAGRVVKAEMPDGSFTRVVFDAWKQIGYDTNDTVADSAWYRKRLALPDSHTDKQAARKTEVHGNTPSVFFLDTLGRLALGRDHNRYIDAAGLTREEFHYTWSEQDIEGNVRSVTDARGNVVMQYRQDMLGHPAAQISMDAGRRWMLNNVLGNPVRTWDERAHTFSFQYDVLHRPTGKRISGGDGPVPLDHLYELTIYGESVPNAKQRNLRGQAAVLYDTAGKVTTDRYDFKGNVLATTRSFAANYKETPDWAIANPDSLLAGSDYVFTTRTEYDALNRVISQTTPDGKVTRPAYNPAALLEKVTLREGSSETPIVVNIDYDAKGQRQRIEYGNGVTTRYEYDPETFRLIQLRSQKAGGELLQDLRYTYDPSGNITRIEDRAIPTVFFNNRKITGRSEYTYDALYRLIAATGREQNVNTPNFGADDNWNDAYAMFAHNSGDPMAMRVYTQYYRYDVVGNILQMRHEAGSNGSWTRDYAYETRNNRLRSTTAGSQTYDYPHHPQHGYMTDMPHLQRMAWTFREELASTSQQAINEGTPETTWYVYDGSGQRARKVTELAAAPGATPALKDERVYVGAYEVYRNQNGLERETLHLMDDKQRIAMLDTEVEPRRVLGLVVGRTTPVRTMRYQMGNHLGSASLELDENAAVISYEEYHPYGTTAYQARNAAIKSAAKRYRYTGMERDEETGLEYHSARYYVVWLGRWVSADPIGVGDGVNVFNYSRNNSIVYNDNNGYHSREPHRPCNACHINYQVVEYPRPIPLVGPVGTYNVMDDVEADAMLADDSYRAQGESTPNDLPQGYQRLSDDQISKLGLDPKKFRNSRTGFYASLYAYKSENGETAYVLAFRGTDEYIDWATNGFGAFGGKGALFELQYRFAMELGEAVKGKVGSKADLKFVGHSLGGGLASAAAVVTNSPAVTFNSSTLHPDTVARYIHPEKFFLVHSPSPLPTWAFKEELREEAKMMMDDAVVQEDGKQIRTYFTIGDPLTLALNSTLKNSIIPGVRIERALGLRNPLNSPEKPMSVEAHSMKAVLAALRRRPVRRRDIE
ncbi:MAG: SpvB/TcaC N-terminal domain-containing protein [Saprospiraceae bacterium]